MVIQRRASLYLINLHNPGSENCLINSLKTKPVSAKNIFIHTKVWPFPNFINTVSVSVNDTECRERILRKIFYDEEMVIVYRHSIFSEHHFCTEY